MMECRVFQTLNSFNFYLVARSENQYQDSNVPTDSVTLEKYSPVSLCSGVIHASKSHKTGSKNGCQDCRQEGGCETSGEENRRQGASQETSQDSCGEGQASHSQGSEACCEGRRREETGCEEADRQKSCSTQEGGRRKEACGGQETCGQEDGAQKGCLTPGSGPNEAVRPEPAGQPLFLSKNFAAAFIWPGSSPIYEHA